MNSWGNPNQSQPIFSEDDHDLVARHEDLLHVRRLGNADDHPRCAIFTAESETEWQNSILLPTTPATTATNRARIAARSVIAGSFHADAHHRDFAIATGYRENTIPTWDEGMATYSARLRAPADFGLALQQARIARGVSQTELALELGIPQSTISAMESGKTTIYLRRLLTLARATGIEFTATWSESPAAPR